ncbi:uncharacterized protein M421DRAFT_62912 [Didymella exigua CBS 183.55]|uniref:Uncharacterized protein n=1 Tax=Didymella exigua CBS 183.55 TaxID=1150837 RepID=A0A6A5RM15_9PLEO|nr:uncharacterized protein M421DRAFT_62912 [Didymella exigua CBS 183.55]KAF1928493.1 hypothetical protein M421DRAFT_62912 [Didymella exigua CBS 183.55]
MEATVQHPPVFQEEKISIEPDLGDQRQSTFKALPAPPKTPKRVLMKYRFSGVFPLILSLAAFALSLVVVLAGQNVGVLEGQYLVAVRHLSASQFMNLTLTNLVNQTGIKDFYYAYLQKVCSGSAGEDGSNADRAKIDDCRSYEDAGLSALSRRIRSSLVVGETRVSVPLLAKLVSSLESILGTLNALRVAIFAFLVIALVASLMSAVSVLPAVYFPHSRLLVYANVFWPALASASAFLAAVIASAIAVLVGAVGGFSNTVGVQIGRGATALLFVWLSAVFTGLGAGYWASVWFVETRRSSFMKRGRDDDEVGNWRGVAREVWRDLNGRRRKPSMRAGL